MLNIIAFLLCMFTATYQSVFKHNETSFVHWMLWAIVCALSFLVNEKLSERKGK
jgi:hypothetical protein